MDWSSLKGDSSADKKYRSNASAPSKNYQPVIPYYDTFPFVHSRRTFS